MANGPNLFSTQAISAPQANPMLRPQGSASPNPFSIPQIGDFGTPNTSYSNLFGSSTFSDMQPEPSAPTTPSGLFGFNQQSFLPPAPSTMGFNEFARNRPTFQADTSSLSQFPSLAENLRTNTGASGVLNQQANNRMTQPIVSSVAEPGLRPFNRFNPTTQQFEQLFGNQNAIDQFDDSQEFLKSVRDQAQLNAQNFLGQQVTPQQIEQANNLANLMGTTANISASGPDDKQFLGTAEYGTEFQPRSAEELNKLLNMQQRQRQQDVINSELYQGAMADRNEAAQESREAFDKQSRLAQARAARSASIMGEPFVRVNGTKLTVDEARSIEPPLSEFRRQAAALNPNLRRRALDKVARGLRDEFRREQQKQMQEARAEAQEGFDAELKSIETAEQAQQLINELPIPENMKNMISPSSLVNISKDKTPDEVAKTLLELAKDTEQYKTATSTLEGTATQGEDLESQKLYYVTQQGLPENMKEQFPQGTTVYGGFNKSGQLVSYDQNGNKSVFDPLYASGFSESSQVTADLQKTLNEIKTKTNGVLTIAEYRNALAKSPEGLKQVKALFTSAFKSATRQLFGTEQEFTKEEFDSVVARGQFNAVLGVLRIPVLGPGVMTEPDALRLMQAVGGFGAFSNRDAQLRLLDDLARRLGRDVLPQAQTFNNTVLRSDSRNRELFANQIFDLDSILNPSQVSPIVPSPGNPQPGQNNNQTGDPDDSSDVKLFQLKQ